jgi:hypothetical protein
MPWLWLSVVLLIDQPPVETVDFDTQVMPLLTKAGCNAGACHGAAAGRGGFHLSLYGSRPSADFSEITMALEGRRIDRRKSELSLLLLKPTEQFRHEGGTRLEPDGRDYRTVLQWIAQGSRRTESRRLAEFTLTSEAIDRGENSDRETSYFKLNASAKFSDGSVIDVLPWTVLTPNDPSGISIDEQGVAALLRPGRHLIMARFLDQVRPLELLVPWTVHGKPLVPAVATDAATGIDDFINRRLEELGLAAAPAIDDAGFLRRVTLDLIGRLPKTSTVEQFVESAATDKKSKLIDQLLQSDEFSDFWTFRLALLLRVPQAKGNPAAAKVYYDWLHDCVRRDVPLNEIARQLLMADGKADESGPANFFNVAGDARGQAEFVSQIFMGVRLQCANCHDHPLDAWTQDDYHGLAAVFARMKRGAVVRESTSGEVIHPGTGETAIAKIPGGRLLSSEANYRMEFTEWLTSKENDYFSRAMTNRVWSHLMGRGLVDPVDDMRVTNPATHPELLDWLAKDLTSHEFKLRHIIRRICISDVYSRGATANADPATAEFYVAAIPKPMSPEVFLDAVVDVTGVSSPGLVDRRAVSFAGLVNASESLDMLGRCRESCESSAVDRTDLAVQLQLLNGEVLNGRLSAEDGTLMKAVRSGQAAESLIHDFYLRAFSRPPRDSEMTFWISQLSKDAGTDHFAEVAQDFVWSLLNSDEFCTNH